MQPLTKWDDSIIISFAVPAYIHVRTAFELVAEAINFLSKTASNVGLTLVTEAPVMDGEDVGFCISLEDDTSVLEGRGRAASVVDRGPFAAADERFEIVLTALALDDRNARMFERVLDAQKKVSVPSSSSSVSWPPSMMPEDFEPGLQDPPRGSLVPALVPQELEAQELAAHDLDAADHESDHDHESEQHPDDRSSQTRVVRAEELLRSASLSVHGHGAAEALPLPSELVARARSLAPALAGRAGHRPTAGQVVVHALRLGLAVLETQVADDAWKPE
jgi:hypothetical protein